MPEPCPAPGDDGSTPDEEEDGVATAVDPPPKDEALAALGVVRKPEVPPAGCDGFDEGVATPIGFEAAALGPDAPRKRNVV